MKSVKLLILCSLIFSFFSSCAPVKFSKADSQVIGTDCEGIACSPGVNSIICSPKINNNLLTFTYTSSTENLPNISSNCTPADVDYAWTVKKPDSTVITIPISGLAGANPSGVNLTVLGPGTYYVFLNATKTGSGLSAFNSSTPLEFVVPGTGVGNSLTCDPKLNGTLTSVVVNPADNNPTVTANCVPMASTYIWTAKKDGTVYTVTGLSGASSTPNFKSFGAGTYELYLYATLTGSTHWQSAAPLTVRVVAAPPPVTPPIQCNPRINGSLTDLTITPSTPNPLISANCLPTNVQYAWSVTKNGTAVNVTALMGANSNPNFGILGKGTYLISLTATAPNYLPWNTTSPLKITVDDAPVNNLTLNCSPRLNNVAVAVTVAQNGSNPLVTSGCVPATVTHTWSVFKAGQAVTIAGLAGASSTGQFIQAGLGTYYIYLTASAPGYNTYVSPTPLEVSVAVANNPYRDVVYEKLVTADNKVDILLVVDDSKSMEPENTKLAQKLQAFVADLKASGIDWQMCATVTRSQDVNNNGQYFWGASRNWTGYIGSPQWILNAGAINPYAIFTDTMSAIGAGWAGTDDERGIKAAWWSFEYAQYNNCYRQGASIAVILISDEDERSIGGDQSLEYYGGEFKVLEADDQPQELLNKVKQKFGADKRFTFNSIIVKPGDSACMAAQDAGGASKSHYGYKYAEISQLSGGYVGNICDADYSQNLYYFKDKIINSAASFPLECAPVGPVTVTITPTVTGYTTAIVNNTIVFNPAIPAGRTVKLQYKCSTM